MTDDEIKAQAIVDADELEFTYGSQYPAGSDARAFFCWVAEIARRRFTLSDGQKIKLILKLLTHVQPCTKDDLASRSDFSRNESRRLIDQAVSAGVIEQVSESTNGRARILLHLP